MHASPQLKAYFAAQGHGVGAHLHFLAGGNARVGAAQIGGPNAAAGQQCFAGQAFGLEGAEYQRYSVEGSEVGVQHVGFLHEGAGSEQVVCRGVK